jgi:hypothetical protein
LAVFLLQANGWLRWVRGGFFQTTGRAAAGFEIEFNTAPDAAVLGRALTGLSLAASICAREARSLAGEDAAALFMEVGVGPYGQITKT